MVDGKDVDGLAVVGRRPTRPALRMVSCLQRYGRA
jgi:hypothetical protein